TATTAAQTGADIAAGITEGLGTTVGGVKFAKDVPGYTKINAFRVWGDIFRLSSDYQIGSIKGQIRAGLWLESNKTPRSRYDYDMTKCLQNGIDPFGVRFENATACQDSTLQAKGSAVKLPGGYAEYDEHSAWHQYQPFLELEIHPIENLTITPG